MFAMISATLIMSFMVGPVIIGVPPVGNLG